MTAIPMIETAAGNSDSASLWRDMFLPSYNKEHHANALKLPSSLSSADPYSKVQLKDTVCRNQRTMASTRPVEIMSIAIKTSD